MTVDTLLPPDGGCLAHPRLAAITAFADNYIWALRSPDNRECLVVDPGDPGVVRDWLDREGLVLRAILVTHHHMDHIGGIAALRSDGVTVYGPRHEAISGVDVAVGAGDTIALPSLGATFSVIDVPGHTAGHIAFYGDIDGRGLLFCGDTLFSAGCGRLFEGTAGEMHDSLSRLASLPGDTLVCCAHEYTLGNLRFAAHVEPGNPDIAAVTAWAKDRRARGLPTVPSSIARERRINPFLRTDIPAVLAAVRDHANVVPEGPAATFGALRRWKDGFH